MFILDYRGPYDWAWMCGFLRHRTVEGVEIINDDSLQRVMAIGDARGLATIHIAGNNHFRVEAHARQEHFHLLAGGILRFVENDEAVVQRAARI